MGLSPWQILAAAEVRYCIVTLFLLWILLCLLFKRLPILDKPLGSAHQVVVLLPFCYLAFQGSRLWLFDDGFAAAFADDRVFGFYAPAQSLVLVFFGFQVWDLTVTLVTPELCKPDAIIHHSVSGVLALIGLSAGTSGFLLYYGAFFFGFSEVSSVPLAAVDIFRMNKRLASAMPSVNEACRVSFAALFLGIRCAYWPFVAFDFWRQTLASGAPFSLLSVWWAANIGLTLLQYYWGMLIVKGIIKMVTGKKDSEGDAGSSGDGPLLEGGSTLQ